MPKLMSAFDEQALKHSGVSQVFTLVSDNGGGRVGGGLLLLS